MIAFMRNNTWLAIPLACAILFFLWLPGLKYPIVSDTALYALLGESIWHGNGYTIFGEPYAKHLPLHAITSYPLVWQFGYSTGMKMASVLAGMAVLCCTYLIGKRQFSASIAAVATLLVAVHHGFVWMTIVASADVLFTALFLSGLYAFLRAEKQENWYLLAGLFWGLACITRYNGMPLLALYALYVLLARPQHKKSMPFWCGGMLGGGIFSIWLLRNWRVFGSPFFTEYTGELENKSAGLFLQLVENTLFYINPLHNILPILFVCSVYGLWKQGRQQPVLLWSMLAVLLLSSIWWVQAMRFAFPAYPLLILFAVWGLFQWNNKAVKQWNSKVVQKCMISLTVFTLLFTHVGALCLYASGSCNAGWDATVGFIPKNLGLTSEGFYAAYKARSYMNNNAAQGARIYVGPVQQKVSAHGIYRSDVVLLSKKDACPYYRITSEPLSFEEVLFTSNEAPHMSVVLHSCQ